MVRALGLAPGGVSGFLFIPAYHGRKISHERGKDCSLCGAHAYQCKILCGPPFIETEVVQPVYRRPCLDVCTSLSLFLFPPELLPLNPSALGRSRSLLPTSGARRWP
jgi:hypothetical protein